MFCFLYHCHMDKEKGCALLFPVIEAEQSQLFENILDYLMPNKREFLPQNSRILSQKPVLNVILGRKESSLHFKPIYSQIGDRISTSVTLQGKDCMPTVPLNSSSDRISTSVTLPKVLDATSKLPPGVLQGTFVDYGSFDECLAVEGPGARFTGQSCAIEARPPYHRFHLGHIGEDSPKWK
ncbi:hypothetical protein HNY73_014358 [Argiope bruennichi]|uniref:Nose resistant-to-fluoxetine protein N-terminal domain-containing protein n=1 Tax=Argiope bruennichi TaxID=94029 RepID=A0A8T0EQE2_ARGBR|nr:hypothetical protein HNY73_014358 [Argiope bruennichi]